MSKYDMLWKYIRMCGEPQLTLTFDEIGINMVWIQIC